MVAEHRSRALTKLAIVFAVVVAAIVGDPTANKAYGAESPEVVWRTRDLARPRGVDVDRQGIVYVADTENHAIRTLDAQGNLLAVWGRQGNGPGEFSYPRDVAVDPDGRVYVADTLNDRIQILTADGKFAGQIGRGRGSAPGRLDGPKAVAVDGWGNVYVADTFNDRIQVFDADGAVLFGWGGSGSMDGQFRNPGGIAVSESGVVYVSDTFHDRVQAFNAAGGFLRTWGATGDRAGGFVSPRGIDVDNAGRVFVSDSDNHRIQVFAPDGSHLQTWGSRGEDRGEFDGPKGLAVGPGGRIYVADQLNDAITVYEALSPPEADLTADDRTDFSIGPASAIASEHVASSSHNLVVVLLLRDGERHVADFPAFFRFTGGLERWGDPLSEVFEERAGSLTQYFQRGAIDWRYNYENRGFEFQRRLAWEFVGGGDAEGGDMGFEPNIVNQNPGVALGPWGHRVSNVAVDGSATGFLDFYSTHGGVASFGFPKSDARPDGESPGMLVWSRGLPGRVRQYFQAAVLEYSPGQQPSVVVPMIGYDLLWTLYGGDAWRKIAEFEPAGEVGVGAAFGFLP